MRARWKKNKNLRPRVILEKINSIKTIRPHAIVSPVDFEFQDAIAALQSMVQFPRLEEGIDRGAIVSAAIDKAIKKRSLTDDLVINEINAEIRSALSKKEDIYYLLTSVSLREPYPADSIISGDCKIQLSSLVFPKKFASRYESLKIWEGRQNTDPLGYAKVVIRTKAKSEDRAVHKALRELDLQRAIWNLLGNSSIEFRFGGEAKPINKIRLGAAHTLHDKQGYSSENQFWYEPNFIIATPYVPKDVAKYAKEVRWINRRLKSHPYGYELKEALLRFVRALDERDYNVALIRLWGALESLAAPSEQNYDRVTKRASFLFRDRAYHEQILEHLRDYRNRNVHASEGDDRAITACFQLQRYFRYLVQFHLKNSGSFQTLDEANAFLDLPSEIDALKVKERQIKKAIKFVSPDA